LRPSRALVGEKVRGEKFDFLQMRQNARIRGAGKGIGSLIGSALGLRNGLGPYTYKLEKGGLQVPFSF